MPTLIDLDSFQHRVLRVAGPWYTVSAGEGSTQPAHDGVRITFDPTEPRTADHAVSLKVVHSATAGQATQVRRVASTGIPGASNTSVFSFYFKCDTPPASSVDQMYINGAPTNATLGLNSSGGIRARVGTGAAQDSTTNVCDGEWHLIDGYYNSSTTPGTLDVRIDDTEDMTQATGTITAGNMDSWNFGGTSVAPAAYTSWYSDYVLSGTAADYPIGHHICLKREITGKGTHSLGSGGFQDEGGSTTDDFETSVDDAWDGTTPELSQTGEDYVQQTANDAAAYVEFTVADARAEDTAIWAVELGALMAAEDATTANNGETRVTHSGTTYATTGLIDPSVSSSVYAGYRRCNTSTPGGDGWSDTEFNAITVRFGFSTDAAPDVIFNSAIVEYAAPWSAVSSTQLVIQDATHAHAADNLALTQHNVLAVQDATHGHSAENLALTQHNILAIQDASHAHTADNEVLGVGLTVQDAAHGHTADGLGLTQHHILAIQDASHAHAADNLALTQHNVLAIQDAAHGHAADNLALTQHNALAVQDALHAHAADSLTLTAHEPGAGSLEIQDAAHAHAADSLVLGVGLVIADASHGHAADNLVLTQHNVLAIADALHAHTADVPALSIPGDEATPQNVVRLRRRRPLAGS